jgi:hypothetical protein
MFTLALVFVPLIIHLARRTAPDGELFLEPIRGL